MYSGASGLLRNTLVAALHGVDIFEMKHIHGPPTEQLHHIYP